MTRPSRSVHPCRPFHSIRWAFRYLRSRPVRPGHPFPGSSRTPIIRYRQRTSMRVNQEHLLPAGREYIHLEEGMAP
jgi:hypothetical protein